MRIVIVGRDNVKCFRIKSEPRDTIDNGSLFIHKEYKNQQQVLIYQLDNYKEDNVE